MSVNPGKKPRELDRRWIYLLVAASLALPIIGRWSLPPAEMETSTAFYQTVDKLEREQGKIVLIAVDWTAQTQAENRPQTEVAMEHLMRKRVPFAMISLLQLAVPFMETMPRQIAARLEAETGEKWEYGKDWVNFGYQPSPFLAVQGLAKAKHIRDQLSADMYGTPYDDLPALAGVTTIRDIPLLLEFTGSVGLFNLWLQFFQAEGYRPPYLHGCTAISIPEVHSFYSSKQILGFHEGAAGAAWYEKLLNDNYPNRKSNTAISIMTSLAVAHLVVVGLIVVGNVTAIAKDRRRTGA